MLVLGLGLREEQGTIIANKGQRIIVGNPTDNRDIRIELLDYKDRNSSISGKEEAKLFISKPNGTDTVTLQKDDAYNLGRAKVMFLGKPSDAWECRFGFETPVKNLPINREPEFRRKFAGQFKRGIDSTERG